MLAGSQSVPSTAVQLTPPDDGGRAQVPGFVGDTGLPLGPAQVPVQQSAEAKQMSPVWMQYEEAMLQTPPVQRPEQQSAPFAQTFPAVVQLPTTPPSVPAPIGAHFPVTHVPVQHTFPEAGQVAPIERHCAAPQAPFTQPPPQQSVLTAHVAPAVPHVPGANTHLFPRQRCAQQSLSCAHVA
jgi:hypothetical protein